MRKASGHADQDAQSVRYGNPRYGNPIDRISSSLGRDASDECVVTIANAVHNAAMASGTVAERAYLDTFHSSVDSGQEGRRGLQFLIRSEIKELSEHLPSDAAMGHVMMTVGMHNDQFYWCDICGAYTNSRARKLTKPCDRVARRLKTIDKLRSGVHRMHGTELNSIPRRMVKRDTGTGNWYGDGCPEANRVLAQQVDHTDTHEEGINPSVVELPYSAYLDEDEDPLGHGLTIS